MSGATPDPVLRGLRVLVIEDMLHVAWELCDQLRSAGADVAGPVGRLEPAVELAQREPIDAAVLDVALNGHSAAPVAAALQRRRVPFVLVSGYAPGDLPGEMQGAPLLAKPVRFEDLVQALLTAVRAPASGDDADPA